MKKQFLILSAACAAMAFTASSRAGTSVAIGFQIGAPAPIVVRHAPPRHIVERIPAAPGPGYVWINGHHSWINGAWVWYPGTWMLPPQPGAVYVEGRWDPQTQNWVEGYWSVPPPPPPPPAPVAVVGTTTPTVVAPSTVIVDAPPPLQTEVITVRPSPRHVWIPGYWVYRGHHHVWMAGHWALPPHAHMRWVEPRWERRGGSYVFIEGSWR